MTFVRELLSYFSQVMYLLLAFTFGMASVCITAFTISVPLRIAGRKQRMLISPCERGPVPGWCRLYQTLKTRGYAWSRIVLIFAVGELLCQEVKKF